MKLGLMLGYWSAQPPKDTLDVILEAERLGFDSVWTAEAYGSDALTPLAWYGSQTSKIKLGTAIIQMSARTPTSTAMHALTLDHLSEGRFILGLGVSGPQVVEGWYGEPFAKPLARTREYIDIVRQVFQREAPVTNKGPHYPLPLESGVATGLGKPLKSIVHPLRADLPIYLAAEGPKNIALAAEVADGWHAIYYSPKVGDMYRGWLAEGFARAGARHTKETFEIAATCSVIVTDDVQQALQFMKPMVGFYIGGMGAKEMNFHKSVFTRMGYEKEADEIQNLFLEGKRDVAIQAVTDEMVADINLIGPLPKVRDDLSMWEEAGVTTLLVGTRNLDQMRQLAEVVLGAG